MEDEDAGGRLAPFMGWYLLQAGPIILSLLIITFLRVSGGVAGLVEGDRCLLVPLTAMVYLSPLHLPHATSLV